MPCMRYRDRIGISEDYEARPGVWFSRIVERTYSGDIVKYSSHFQEKADQTNPDIQLRNQISVVGDPYLYDHLPRIRYAWFFGYRWNVSSTEFSGNRLILDLDSLYQEDSDDEEDDDG